MFHNLSAWFKQFKNFVTLELTGMNRQQRPLFLPFTPSQRGFLGARTLPQRDMAAFRK